MAVLPYVQRQAIKRFRDGSAGPWGAVAAAAIGLRVMQRLGTRREEVVYREVLKPGQELVVTHRPETVRTLTRAERRADKAAAKASKAANRDARQAKKQAKAAKRLAKHAD